VTSHLSLICVRIPLLHIYSLIEHFLTRKRGTFLQQDWTCHFGNVKAINQFKKSINLGDLPPYYHIVANKLSELEGTFTDGFDNNIKYLLDKKNWNSDNLHNGKPQISLNKHMSEYAYDLFCFPVLLGEAHAVVKPFDSNSPFKQYNPAIVGPLLRIPGLSDFISMTIRCGDEADMELLTYAHILIEQICDLLSTSVVVVSSSGDSIKETFLYIEQQLKDLKTN
jgi:hypothetical protein